ncbi:hypothetical protein Esi_0251_0042 [Ectocarpus siliculosus]|uniref:Uncharacterized protein n=1 Tax=Ectocarpus siliculosus TaxID=2880 RepID=D7FTK9_ECTSI|nr:hypothetical protein Esi_0251_0042 [Ectocarpus siliculosus]|eukprot:CBJ31400.1 hypothetical protein Esi_0251_0042 [Ectocarpus siliculosus]
MASRQSSRVVTPTEKVLALEASRQTAARREAGDSSRASFRAAGDGHAQKVMSLGGEETPVQGEDSDAEVVAVDNPSSAAPAGKKKKRVSPKWSTWSDLTLMKHAIKHKTWRVAGLTDRVEDRKTRRRQKHPEQGIPPPKTSREKKPSWRSWCNSR